MGMTSFRLMSHICFKRNQSWTECKLDYANAILLLIMLTEAEVLKVLTQTRWMYIWFSCFSFHFKDVIEFTPYECTYFTLIWFFCIPQPEYCYLYLQNLCLVPDTEFPLLCVPNCTAVLCSTQKRVITVQYMDWDILLDLGSMVKS